MRRSTASGRTSESFKRDDAADDRVAPEGMSEDIGPIAIIGMGSGGHAWPLT